MTFFWVFLGFFGFFLFVFCFLFFGEGWWMGNGMGCERRWVFFSMMRWVSEGREGFERGRKHIVFFFYLF